MWIRLPTELNDGGDDLKQATHGEKINAVQKIHKVNL